MNTTFMQWLKRIIFRILGKKQEPGPDKTPKGEKRQEPSDEVYPLF